MTNQLTKFRARYAPSPTGYFHIGGARTALFNYLFAKHFNGDFIVRIEDTDVARNVEGGIESQLENLKWMGIVPDESILNPGQFGPYKQTEKLERYKQLAYSLVEKKLAYFCFCDEAELEKQREIALANHQTPKYNRRCYGLSQEQIQANLDKKIPYVIRLKMVDNINIEWDDLIRGHMSVPTSALTDPVILKSNGIPMYNFAVVVDDYDMQITHVLRGEEHISNTPYQIAIKKALGFDHQEIKYGHLSIITDETGKKLSKRNKALKQFIEDYRKMGFLPIGVNNFLSLLGWSPKNNQEIMDLATMIKNFDLNSVSKAPACFDYKKMLWINSQHIKGLSDEQYLKFIKNFVNIESLNKHFDPTIHDLICLTFKNQINYGEEINDLIASTFFNHLLTPEMTEFIKLDSSVTVLKALKEELTKLDKLDLNSATELVNKLKSLPIKGKNLFMPLRIAAIFKEHGPELNKIFAIVGKDKILKNVQELLKVK